MYRKSIAGLLAVLLVAGMATGQQPARLRWKAGQVLLYKVAQTIVVTETTGEKKSESTIKLNHTKRWQVLAVDANGVATVQNSLVALRHETLTADGKSMLFDSANLDKSTPELKVALGKFVGPALAVLRVDDRGRVLEVKESKFGPASRYESELPFAGVLPTEPLKAGLTWERTYNVTLDPTGNGKKYSAVQRYTCKSVTSTTATIGVITEFKTQSDDAGERVRLLQLMPEGEIIFDLSAGRFQSATLKIDKATRGLQGADSKMHVKSSYVEQYAGD